MPRSTRKKSAKKVPAVLSAAEILTSLPDISQRAGMPALDSITGIQLLATPGVSSSGAPSAAAAKAGTTYRIIKTNEVDAYEQAATSQETAGAPMAAAAAPTGDKFKGTARKAAKLSIAGATTEKFNDVKTLVNSLTPDTDMIALKIKKTSTSNRVKEEKRNVRVKAFIYAASREDDNDFHLIIGRNPSKSPETYMTMELSGLPPTTSSSFAKLNAARNSYKAFFAADLPGLTYDFYDPPIPVTIEGSLFFDASHSSGTRPGPKSLKSRMPTVWEVHPITSIKF